MTDEEFTDLIESKTTRRIEFDATQMPLFGRPVVYMALSHNECLYIGMSTNGLGRVFGRGHHVLSHIADQIVKLEVYETATKKDAEHLEALMIQEFNPKHNDRKYITTAQRTRGERSRVSEIITRAGY